MINTYLIYKHTSPSGKCYIGQTGDYEKRCKNHKKPNNNCVAFRNALNKYGWDNFTHEILHKNLSKDSANVLEELYILEYNSIVPNGYNLKSGGNSNIPSKESIEKSTKKNSRNWKFVDPIGNIVDIFNLSKFCRENDLNDSSMNKVYYGKISNHLGWTSADEDIVNMIHQKMIKNKYDASKKISEARSRMGCTLSKDQLDKMSRPYSLIDPAGNIVQGINLRKLCRDNELSQSNMQGLLSGRIKSSKGWKLYAEIL